MLSTYPILIDNHLQHRYKSYLCIFISLINLFQSNRNVHGLVIGAICYALKRYHNILSKLNINIDFFDNSHEYGLKNMFRINTKLIYLESLCFVNHGVRGGRSEVNNNEIDIKWYVERWLFDLIVNGLLCQL